MPSFLRTTLRATAAACLAILTTWAVLATAGCSGSGGGAVQTGTAGGGGLVPIPVEFANPLNFAAGSQPWGIATADLNNDGFLDLVVTNSNGGNVSVLLGDGAGNFGAANNFNVNNTPEGVALGNVDGANGPDIVVNNRDSNNVTVLLNAGNGTFAEAGNSPFAVGNAPEGGCVLADFNGDTFLDIATANHDSSDISVLLGNGAGNFGAATAFDAGAATGTFGLATADLNGDGFLDFAAANHDGANASALAILLGAGNGTFGAAAFFAGGLVPQGISVADFNGDGSIDVAQADNFADNANVFLNNGNAVFGAATNFAVGSNPVYGTSALDLNKDNIPDLTISNSGDDSFSVLLGMGDGTFQAAANTSTGAATGPIGLVVADFDGDTRLDVATANFNSDNVSVLLRQ